MTIFDLLFLFVTLAVVIALGMIVIAVLRGRRRQAARALGLLGLSLALYLAVVAGVSLATPQRVLARGEDRCYDDWCIAVVGVARTERAAGAQVSVVLRLTNRAQRVAQRENGVVVYVMDESGRRFDAPTDPAAVPFNVLLEPGRSLSTTRTFDAAGAAGQPVLVIAHEGASRFPGVFIIGDDSSLLHKPLIVRL